MAETTTGDAVLLEVTDDIATITMNRPDVRNALVPGIQSGILDALDAIEERDDVRCVVLAGDEAAFCAGGNIEAMGDADGGGAPAEGVERIVGTVHRVLRRLANFPLPTVARVEGVAVGAGASLALACDVQVASDDVRIGWVFRTVGLAIDSGTSYFLPRVVGVNVAKELVYTGEILDAERAAELGIFNRVYPAEEFDGRFSSFIEPIATGPTAALTVSKRLLDHGVDSTLDRALDFEATAQGTLFDTNDHEEGVLAFSEDREPEFEGR